MPIQDGTQSVYADQLSERIEFRYHGNATYGAPMIGGAPTLTLSNSLGSPLVPGYYSGNLKASNTPWANPSFYLKN
ncbi:hypothetical protein [Solimicrobium silvestre]|uniref:hypothetical protein n=1 Tax=Solimicrobium silvestre TaxID=2099400 RepID=UPI001056F1A8|nr:hypothetical protein [Solimicrobium silvestre]